MNRLSILGSLVFASVTLAACGGGGSLQRGNYPVPALNGEVTCYEGKTVVGGSATYLTGMRSAWDQSTSTLTQDTVTIINDTPSRTTASFVGAADGSLTISGAYKGGTFTGSGTVTDAGAGPWAAWKNDLKFDVGGTSIESDSQLSATAYKARTVINGTMYATDAKPMTAEDCDIFFSNIEPL